MIERGLNNKQHKFLELMIGADTGLNNIIHNEKLNGHWHRRINRILLNNTYNEYDQTALNALRTRYKKYLNTKKQ